MSSSKPKKYISPTVAMDESGSSICTACGTKLADAGTDWKEGAVLKDVPLAKAGGPAFDTGHEGVVLRHAYCPNCATLLDTETATSQDPSLLDRVE